MYFISALILLGLLIINNRRNVYTLAISTVLFFIRIYLYLSSMIIRILPKYIYHKTFSHRTSQLDYSVYEYWGKYNNKYYKFRIIDDNHYDIKDAFSLYNPNNMNLINYCGVIDDNGDHLMDITQEIRYFMYYKGLIEWKYILVHLGLENYKKLVVYMNDMDMTEKIIELDTVYEQKFNF